MEDDRAASTQHDAQDDEVVNVQDLDLGLDFVDQLEPGPDLEASDNYADDMPLAFAEGSPNPNVHEVGGRSLFDHEIGPIMQVVFFLIALVPGGRNWRIGVARDGADVDENMPNPLDMDALHGSASEAVTGTDVSDQSVRSSSSSGKLDQSGACADMSCTGASQCSSMTDESHHRSVPMSQCGSMEANHSGGPRCKGTKEWLPSLEKNCPLMNQGESNNPHDGLRCSGEKKRRRTRSFTDGEVPSDWSHAAPPCEILRSLTPSPASSTTQVPTPVSIPSVEHTRKRRCTDGPLCLKSKDEEVSQKLVHSPDVECSKSTED